MFVGDARYCVPYKHVNTQLVVDARFEHPRCRMANREMHNAQWLNPDAMTLRPYKMV